MVPDFTRSRLSQELEDALQALVSHRRFPKGSLLYRQGEDAAGIFLVASGCVRVTLPTNKNENQLLELVGPGSLLGLSETMSGVGYRSTAEAGEATSVAFVPRQEFLNFLNCHREFCMQVVRLLSDNLHALYHKFRNVSAHPGRPRRRSLDRQLN